MTEEQRKILSFLSPAYPWAELLSCQEQVDSTNTRLRELALQGAPQGTALVAQSQTLGKGRMGRSFHSPAGSGIYLSILLRPECPPSRLMHLTCSVGVAMCDAVEAACGLRPGIKWINDLIYGTKKLGGILVETGLSSAGTIDYAIAGIGINCSQRPEDFPPELRDKACSLEMCTGSPVNKEKLAAAMLEALYRMNSILLTGQSEILAQYRSDCATIGREVYILRNGAACRGTALDVDAQGALLVRFSDGHTETVNSGEASVRGLYGYNPL